MALCHTLAQRAAHHKSTYAGTGNAVARSVHPKICASFMAVVLIFVMAPDVFSAPYLYSYSSKLSALADCMHARQGLESGVPQPQPPGSQAEIHVSSCSIRSGYFVGYYNWYVLTAEGKDYHGNPTGAEYWFLYPGAAVPKNAGSGASGDGGQGGNSCPNEQGAAMVGDPINATTGNKYIEEVDYANGDWLVLRRFYNSEDGIASSNLGPQWRHSFDRVLVTFAQTSTPTKLLYRPDGKLIHFTKPSSGSPWYTSIDIKDTLTEVHEQGVLTGYKYFIAALNAVEFYSVAGKLMSVSDSVGQKLWFGYSDAQTDSARAPIPGLLLEVVDDTGRKIEFYYNANALIESIVLPNGSSIGYTYESATLNLSEVSYPGSEIRRYEYNESGYTAGADFPHHLTGVIDENGDRFEETYYDVNGRAVATHMNGGVEGVMISYLSATSSSMQFALGGTANIGFITRDGVNKVSSVSSACGNQCGQSWASRSYDSYGKPATSTDFRGNQRRTTYSPDGLLTQETNGYGTPVARSRTITWDVSKRKPLTITEAGKVTGFSYDANGNLLSTSVSSVP